MDLKQKLEKVMAEIGNWEAMCTYTKLFSMDFVTFRDSLGWLFVLLYLSSIPSMICRCAMKKATTL